MNYLKWIIAALLIGVIGYLAYGAISDYGDRREAAGRAAVQAVLDIERGRHRDNYLKLAEMSQQTERNIRESFTIIEQEKTDEINRIRATHRADLERLRQRPTAQTLVKYRTEQCVSPAPAGAEAGTGSLISAEDAEFLVGEAARADEVVAERDAIWGLYEAARVEVEEFRVGRFVEQPL